MKKRLYNDKRPRAHALLPREHYAKKNGSWKPKRAFPSELSARLYLSTQMSADGYRTYRCTVCGKWHVGKYTKDGEAGLAPWLDGHRAATRWELLNEGDG